MFDDQEMSIFHPSGLDINVTLFDHACWLGLGYIVCTQATARL
jgi:hypothetical protein